MHEEIRIEKNEWRVSEEIAYRIDGEPVLGKYIDAHCHLFNCSSYFFNQVYAKEYQQAMAGNKPSVPGNYYMQKPEVFMQKHFQLGELTIYSTFGTRAQDKHYYQLIIFSFLFIGPKSTT